MTDDLKREIRLAGPPRRIVSLAPNITEILYALGAGDLLAGVTNQCDFPPDALTRPRVGSMLQPNTEAILTLRPDLIIMTVEGNTEEAFRRLESLGQTIFVLNPRTLEQILAAVHSIGRLTGRTDRAAALCDSLRNTLEADRPKQRSAHPRAMLFVSVDPLMAAGKESFLNEAIEKAGGINAAASAGGSYPVLNREEVVRSDPEVILIPDDLGVNAEELLRRFPEWRFTRAAKTQRIARVDASVLQRPGPRIFAGVRMLREILLSGGR